MPSTELEFVTSELTLQGHYLNAEDNKCVENIMFLIKENNNIVVLSIITNDVTTIKYLHSLIASNNYFP